MVDVRKRAYEEEESKREEIAQDMPQLHIWLHPNYPKDTLHVYYEVCAALSSRQPVISTTLTHFANTRVLQAGYRLIVHGFNNRAFEVKLGENACTNRIIKEGHNLEKLLLNGEFAVSGDNNITGVQEAW